MLLKSQKSGQFLDVFRLNHLAVMRGNTSGLAETSETLRVNLGLFFPKRLGQPGKSQNLQLEGLACDVSLIVEHGPFQSMDLLAEALASFILAQNFGAKRRLMCEAVEVEIIQSKTTDDSYGSVHILRESQEALRYDEASTWNMIFSSEGTALFRGVIEPSTCLRPWLPGWTLDALWTSGSGMKADDREIKPREILKGMDVQKVLLSHESDEPKSFLALAHRQAQPSTGAPGFRALGLIMQKDQ